MEHLEVYCKREQQYNNAIQALKISNIEFYPIDNQTLYLCGRLRKKNIKKLMEDFNIKCKIKKEIIESDEISKSYM